MANSEASTPGSVRHLATTRVLVVDDQPDEAAPILNALAKCGVGAIYVRGENMEDLPESPYEGIRLVFLDLHLGVEGEPKQVLPKTLGVLEKCLCQNAMPPLVVCWTSHYKDLVEFRAMAGKADLGFLRPEWILSLDKPPSGDPRSWSSQLERIGELLVKFDAMHLLWQWEKSVHDSATGTSQTLADIGNSLGKKPAASLDEWQDQVFRICRELVYAVDGKTSSEKQVSQTLFQMLNMLAADRAQLATLGLNLPCAGRVRPTKQCELDSGQIAHLNQMIMLERVPPGSPTIQPGYIYQPQGSNASKCLFSVLGVKDAAVYDKIANKGKPPHGSAAIVVEVSPRCDYAQGKRQVHTFLAGYLLPWKDWRSIASKQKVERSDLVVLGPLIVPDEGEGEVRALILVKPCLYSRPLKKKDAKNKPIACLRGHALTDLQVQAAMHRARPGSLFLRVPGSEDTTQSSPTTSEENPA